MTDKPYIFFDCGRTVVEHPCDVDHILTRRGITDPSELENILYWLSQCPYNK